MNVLDENIAESQRELLRNWKIPFRQIGREVGDAGMSDEQVVQTLHKLRRPTLFTRDRDFDGPALAHEGYCLVYLTISRKDVAAFVWRFLRHPEFRSQSTRMGRVVRVNPTGIVAWKAKSHTPARFAWGTA